MCSGGSKPQAATIYMPDTSSYDRQFDRQQSLLQQQFDSENMALQGQLKSSLQKTQDLMDEYSGWKEEQANSKEAVEAEIAERNRVLLSTAESLVPQQGAQGVQIGASRASNSKKYGGAKKSGKSGLRIQRKPGSAIASAGTGLQFT